MCLMVSCLRWLYHRLFEERTQMNSLEFRAGVRRGIPIIISAAPFAVLFGAIAVDHGLTIAETLLMSLTIYAGASQLVGVELFSHHIAPWLIVLSIFAVNFRHVLYSAAIAKYIRHFSLPQKLLAFFLLIDPQFAEVERKGDSGEPVSFSWYLGLALVIYFPWLIVTGIGGYFGSMIGDPKSLGLDVLLPIYFMGLVLGFRKRANWLPVVVVSAGASVVALKTIGSPWHVSVGALVGVFVAALLPVASEDERA
jgi:predicted branched-subunit amino acid permease